MIFCFHKDSNEPHAVKGDSHEEAFQLYKDVIDEYVDLEDLLFLDCTSSRLIPMRYKNVLVPDCLN
jgi:hypothetical protein